MDKLWAPWRGEFVSGLAGDDECFLCRIARENADDTNFVLHRGERVFALLNRYPYNTGHLMVVPYAHVGDITEIDDPVALELHRVTVLMIGALNAAMRPHGINVGWNLGRAAGAGLVGHVHQHLVPRWNGDTNFMPVIAETKVLSHDLNTVHALILDGIRKTAPHR